MCSEDSVGGQLLPTLGLFGMTHSDGTMGQDDGPPCSRGRSDYPPHREGLEEQV